MGKIESEFQIKERLLVIKSPGESFAAVMEFYKA